MSKTLWPLIDLALAWVPAPTLVEAKAVVEGVYNPLCRVGVAWEIAAVPFGPWRGEGCTMEKAEEGYRDVLTFRFF